MNVARLFLAILCLSTFPDTASGQTKNSKQATKESSNAERQKLSLSRLVRLLQSMKKGEVPQRSVERKIRDVGLAFSLSPENRQKLSDAGATPDLLTLIALLAMPEVEPPPQAPVTGRLNIVCQPLECDVSVAGISKGTTKQGERSLTLTAGRVIVVVSKTGYVSQETDITIEAGKTSDASFDLEPTRATKELLGNQLYSKIVETLGAEAGLRRALNAEADADATFISNDSHEVRFQLHSRFSLPGSSRFDLKGAGLDHRVAWVDGNRESNEGLKSRPELAGAIETDLQNLRDSLLPVLMLRLGAKDATRMAMTVDPPRKGDFRLTVEAGTKTFTILIDPVRYFPNQIEQISSAGSKLISVYSDFDPETPAFPKSMAVRHTVPKASGLEIHFSEISLGHDFKDGDFRVKKRLFH